MKQMSTVQDAPQINTLLEAANGFLVTAAGYVRVLSRLIELPFPHGSRSIGSLSIILTNITIPPPYFSQERLAGNDPFRRTSKLQASKGNRCP